LIGRSGGRPDDNPAPKLLVHARQNGLLTSSAIDDQQVPISPQLALASRRQFSSRVRARPPNSNDGENIPSQDNQRVN